jgi:four helix bundle protein
VEAVFMIDSSYASERPKYDLEHRTQMFAEHIRAFLSRIPRVPDSNEDRDQLFRSSGSVAANYIEANEALGKDDFLMRIRISLKESKESRLWLSLLHVPACEDDLEKERRRLQDEAHQLVRIFSAILRKTQMKWNKPVKRAHQ